MCRSAAIGYGNAWEWGASQFPGNAAHDAEVQQHLGDGELTLHSCLANRGSDLNITDTVLCSLSPRKSLASL